MRKQIAVLGPILALVLISVAQNTASKTQTICLAEIGGTEAKNWNLRVPIMKRLSRKIENQDLNATLTLLDADQKHAAKEASEKQCDLVVYSEMDRRTSEVNSSMNPSPKLRASATVSAPPTSTVRYLFKIKEANGKQLAYGKVEVELKSSFTRSDYEESGREMVEQVAEKIVDGIPK